MTKYHRLQAGLGWNQRQDRHGLMRVRVPADSYLGGKEGVRVRDLAEHLKVSAATVRASLRRANLWEGYRLRGALSLQEAKLFLERFHASRAAGKY